MFFKNYFRGCKMRNRFWRHRVTQHGILPSLTLGQVAHALEFADVILTPSGCCGSK